MRSPHAVGRPSFRPPESLTPRRPVRLGCPSREPLQRISVVTRLLAGPLMSYAVSVLRMVLVDVDVGRVFRPGCSGLPPCFALASLP